jgi:hypothetical protein
MSAAISNSVGWVGQKMRWAARIAAGGGMLGGGLADLLKAALPFFARAPSGPYDVR